MHKGAFGISEELLNLLAKIPYDFHGRQLSKLSWIAKF
jgi:hypothetical protein